MHDNHPDHPQRHRAPMLRRRVAQGAEPLPTPSTRAAQRTDAVLASLSLADWSVSRWLHPRDSGVDHLVIGPAGTVALISRSSQGAVRISGDHVLVDGQRLPCDEWAHAARTAAAEANKQLTAELGLRVLVRAVVVVWGEFPQTLVDGHHVTFVHGDDLISWLQAARVSA